MKIADLEKLQLVEVQSGFKKYSSKFDDVYIYEVQLGWGYATSIIEEGNTHPNSYIPKKEKCVIYTYHDWIDNHPAGKLISIRHTWGLKSFLAKN